MELIDYFQHNFSVSSEIATNLNEIFIREEYPKGHILLQPDNLSTQVFFIEKGFFRSYYYNSSGKDITHHFFGENYIFIPLESTFYHKKCPYGLELLESSTIQISTFPEMEKLLEQSHELEKLFRNLAINMLLETSDHLYAIQFQTAAERYKSLLKVFPNILQKAPLGDIASFLGITQQTLSVIRAQRD